MKLRDLTLAEKLARDLVLNVSELMEATGYSRLAIKRMNPPLACGKMRLGDFWKHVKGLGKPREIIEAVAALTAPSSDLPSIADRLRAPRT